MTSEPKVIPVRCKLHWHKWMLRVNDSGERYFACRFCDEYNTRITANSNSPGGLGFGV